MLKERSVFVYIQYDSVDLHLDLNSEDTLAEENVTDSIVDEVTGGLTGVDHEAVGELHGLGTGSTNLSGNDNLATLGTRLHDETENTIAGTMVPK